jgi:hypothetical protein
MPFAGIEEVGFGVDLVPKMIKTIFSWYHPGNSSNRNHAA